MKYTLKATEANTGKDLEYLFNYATNILDLPLDGCVVKDPNTEELYRVELSTWDDTSNTLYIMLNKLQ